jgi:hypothetical protein
MFAGCTNLTEVTNLPATTLKSNCYENMFAGCTSLAEIPPGLLPATTLPVSCYAGMFKNCTSLKDIFKTNSIFTDKSLTMSSNALSGMFERMYCINNNPRIL